MNRQRLFPLLAVLTFFAAVQPVAADTVVSATVGRTFSGDVEEGHTSYGAAIGFLGEGLFGFEVEGTYTPHFFGPDNTRRHQQRHDPDGQHRPRGTASAATTRASTRPAASAS